MNLLAILVLLGTLPTPALAQEVSTIDIAYTVQNAPMLIRVIERKYGLPQNEIVNVAWCESHFNPAAYNPKDTDGLPAIGVMQFKKKTFYKYAALMHLPNPDITDPIQELDVAGWMFAHGEKRQWGCKNSKVWENTFGAQAP